MRSTSWCPRIFTYPAARRASAVRGHAYRFFLVVPLYTADGQTVFTREHLGQLHRAFDKRFGGSLSASSRSGARYFGDYLSEGTEPVRDYHTIIIVYANPTEPSDRFF